MPYVTRTMMEQEATWTYTQWQPVIADSATFDTWIDTLVTRVSNHTKWRVGAALYGTTDPLVQAIFQEAELVLSQYYLLLASAAIADTTDDPTNVPAHGGGAKIREDARLYLDRYNQILAAYDTPLGRSAWAQPRAAVGDAAAELIPHFQQTVDWGRRS